MNTPTDLKDSLEFILKAISPDPDAITVQSSLENHLTLLSVSLPENITGIIIGKGGKVIKAIRALLSLAYPESRFIIQITN